MANGAVGDIIRVTWNGVCFNQRVMMVHDYRIKTVDAGSDILAIQDDLLDELAASGGDQLETRYAECLSTSYTGLVIWAQRIAPVRMRRSELPMTATGSAGASELTNVQAAVSFNTIFSGRNQQAVKKIGPIPTVTTMVDNGVLTTAYKDLLSLFANSFLNTINLTTPAVELKPVVYHKPPASPNYDELNDFTLGQEARVIRRRTVGLGI